MKRITHFFMGFLAFSPLLAENEAMKEDARIKKLQGALAVGSPIRVALRFAGISYSEYLYWKNVASVVEYCEEQKRITELNTKKTALANAMRSATDQAYAEDKKLEPNADLIALYLNSASFKKEAQEYREIIDKCEMAKTNGIVKHLNRVSTSSDKTEVSASQWFLERALPTQFGKAEPEKSTAVPPIKIEFASSKSDQSLKRLEDMEKEVSGENRKTA